MGCLRGGVYTEPDKRVVFPGIGTGLPDDCDVALHPGLSTLQSALNNVPSSLNGDYVICLHGGAYGNADSVHKTGNTGDSASERLIVKGYPGQTAQIRGYLNLSSTDTGFTIRDLFFDARFENKSDGTTNRGNPDMEPSIHIAGSDTLFTNNHVYGGNNATNAPSGARPMNMRSTCVGYKHSPVRSTVPKNWIHNCGVLGPYSNGQPDAPGLYTSNAANGGVVSDNLIWGNAEQGINGYGSSIGPHGVIFEGNVLWGNGRNMSINGETSGNTVRGSLFLDPLIGNDRNLSGSSNGAPTNVVDNCLDSAIKASNLRESSNVSVPDESMSASGDPTNGTFSLNTTSACLAKYSRTMLK